MKKEIKQGKRYYIICMFKFKFKFSVDYLMSKKISINPEFFKMSGKKEKKQKKKKPKFRESQLKPNKVKKELIARIKEHQQREKQRELDELEKLKKKEDQNFKNEFKDTMDYLEELNKKKKKKRKKKNKTLKVRQPHSQININSTPNSFSPEEVSNIKPNVAPDPPYSILKGGTKPTYRQWKKTLKKQMFQDDVVKEKNVSIDMSPLKIESDDSVENINSKNSSMLGFNERKMRLNHIKSKLAFQEPKKRKIKTRRIRRKITLGKEKGKVGVLVKSKKTRKIIKNEVNILKKKSINEIKEYLRKHNLMKIGSSAPDNIMRGIYESAYLSGDVYNNNADILLHNWNSEEAKD